MSVLPRKCTSGLRNERPSTPITSPSPMPVKKEVEMYMVALSASLSASARET